jgi:lysophospholipase L1-like esterase
MAILRSYTAAFEQNGLVDAAVARYRFNEDSGSTTALDSIDDLSGEYRSGAAPGAAGTIGDGAASFDGSGGFVVVNALSGTLRVATLGDSLADPDAGFQTPGNTFEDDFEAALEASGFEVDYFDHAVGGDRTADGLARVDDVLDDDPDVVILELGTNDAINEVDPAIVEANLREIIDELQDGGVDQILLTGTFGFFPDRPAGNLGYETQELRADFEGIFAQIAGDTPGVVLLTDASGSSTFLGGARIAGLTPAEDTINGGVLESGDPNGLTEDGLHPNDAGIDVIVPRIVPQTISLGVAAGAIGDALAMESGSFEMWFTADAIGQRQTLFAKNANETGAGRTVAQVRENGSIAFIISTDAGPNVEVASAAGVVQEGQAVHATFNFGAGGMELYVNGELVDSDTFTGGITTAEPLVIGVDSGFSSPGGSLDDPQRFFDGTIDEFAVYNRPLTGGEVQQLFDGGRFGSTVVGTADDDTVIGGTAAEDLWGRAGSDVMHGNDGDDTLHGGGGSDELRGDAGDDRLFGDGGNDRLGGAEGDDRLDGGSGNDVLVGREGDDLLRGRDGDDVLSGGADDDELFGNHGRDDLDGGAGNDLLDGGDHRDNLTGGEGSDIFQILDISHGTDRILDFEDGDGGDVLDLHAVLDFGDGDDFNDFVRLTEANGNARLEVDSDGGGDDFTAVFNLIGSGGLDIANLVDDGNVQLTAPTS